MTADELSEPMKAALDKMKEHGRLVRWPGGYWTFPNCPSRPTPNGAAPEWWTITQTINGLARRGTIKVVERHPRFGHPIAYAPCDG